MFQETSGLRLHATYYITKQIIPALNRVFLLAGADLKSWFLDIPQSTRTLPRVATVQAAEGKAVRKSTLDQYFKSCACPLCGALQGTPGLCASCQADPQGAALLLTCRKRALGAAAGVHAQRV